MSLADSSPARPPSWSMSAADRARAWRSSWATLADQLAGTRRLFVIRERARPFPSGRAVRSIADRAG
jgi:hypothetical protein